MYSHPRKVGHQGMVICVLEITSQLFRHLNLTHTGPLHDMTLCQMNRHLQNLKTSWVVVETDGDVNGMAAIETREAGGPVS